MPYVNRQGNFSHGIAGTGAYLNNLQFDGGGWAGWFSPEQIAYCHAGPDGEFVMLYNIFTRQFVRGVTDTTSPFYNKAVNLMFSGGGVWAGFSTAPGMGVFTSTGLHKPLAGLLGVGPAGEIGFYDSYQADGPAFVREPDGSEWFLAADPVYRLQLLGSQRAIWNDAKQQIRVFGLPQPIQLGPAWACKAVEINSVWWVMYYTPQYGIVLHPFDSFVGYSIAPKGDAWLDMSGLESDANIIKCIWSLTEGEGAGHIQQAIINTVIDARTNLQTETPVVVPPINRNIWLGFFTGRPGAVGGWDTSDDPAGTLITPGNSILDVQSGVFYKRDVGQAVGQFIPGHTVEEIEAAAAKSTFTPIAYWDARRWPRYPNLPKNSWLCLQAYQGFAESLEQFEQSVTSQILELKQTKPNQKVAIVCQVYTSNNSLASDLRAQVPVYARLARHANVIALIPFNGNGRKTGLQDHPEVRGLWEELAGSIPSSPEIVVPPVVKPPKFTISEPTFPISGDIPVAVRCVYKADPISGPIDWVYWLYSTAGPSGPWLLSARNPGDDPDHTYRFNTTGNFWIKARAENSAGTDETAAERKVTVNPIIPPDPPEPDPVPITDKLWLKTTHGGYLGVGQNSELVQNKRSVFELHVQEPGIVGLFSGRRYAATESNLQVMVNRESVGSEWEKFQLLTHPDGAISLKSLRVGINAGYISAHDDGLVRADMPNPLSWETFTLEPASSGSILVGRLSIDGRMLRDGSGQYYRSVWSSALAILTREHEGFLDWLVQTGFNGCRVFCGNLGWAGQTPAAALAALPDFLTKAASRGLRVEVTALTGTKDGGYDPRQYIQEVVAICQAHENAILEDANEPWHPSQDGLTPAFLQSCQHLIPGEVINAFGASEDDESDEYAGGPYVTVHLDRSRDEWNMVRRVRELENLSVRTNKPVFNNEPIKFGSQNSNPSIAFTLAALNRGFEIPGVYHSDDGLQGVVPAAGSMQQQLAEAYIRGSRVITTEGRLTFKNSGWGDSPIKEFDGAVRVYSFLGEQNVCVALGIDGRLRIETMNGWQLGGILDEMPGVKVFELVR